jgi:hypothetical protein
VVEEVHGRGFRVSAGSFFQSGPAAAELLVDVIDELVGPHLRDGDVLADLYAGVGVLGACLADRHPGLRVHAVESHPPAVADLRKNLHDVPAHEIVAADVADWGTSGPVAVAVADPARPGLGRSATRAVASAAPDREPLAPRLEAVPPPTHRDLPVLPLHAHGEREPVVAERETVTMRWQESGHALAGERARHFGVVRRYE